jgi:F-type H+-transporting ATPase subunit delta
MAELATIARPYAEALLKASAGGDAAALAAEVTALAQVAADPQMRQFADDPKAARRRSVDVLMSIAEDALRRLARHRREEPGRHRDRQRPPRRAARDRAPVPGAARREERHLAGDGRERVPDRRRSARRGQGGDGAAVPAQPRPARRRPPELIGGIRVIVGDEVLDTSIRARLEQMKAALVA